MMPKKQGWEVCREIRQESMVPILMLTARGEEVDRVLGLELGADDYVVKPFSFRELLARIHSNLRRAAYQQRSADGDEKTRIRLGSLLIDTKRRTVSRHDEQINLSQREFDLLVALLEGKGGVIQRNDLLDRVWGEEWVGDPRTLDVHIRWLREKLEAEPSEPQLILTVRGVGYRLVTADELVS
jgi:DNA-binding response OmpR family regulator